MFADDLLLISASVLELQKMLDVCEAVGCNIGIKFNNKKSNCLMVGPVKLDTPSAMHIPGSQIEWSEKMKYLGVTVKSGCKFAIDVAELRRTFFISVNSILSHCSYTSDIVRLELIEKHCLPILLYCIESLRLDDSALRQLNVWWNMVYRKIFGFNKWESVKNLIFMLQRLDLHHMVNLRTAVFIKHLNFNDNVVLSALNLNLANGPEMYSVCRKCDVKLEWSERHIKYKVYSAFNYLCSAD
jgi:hypothetical protein